MNSLTATPMVPSGPTTGLSMPNCLIFPSASGSLKNCVNMQFPSTGTVVLIMIISWILLLAVAYAIYWFSEKLNPDYKLNYWIILLILVVAGLIVSLIV